MKASSLVLTVGIIFFAVLKFTNTASGPKPTINKYSKGMTFHPFTKLNIKKTDRSKLHKQTTYNLTDISVEQKNHFIRIPVNFKLFKNPGKQLASRVK